MSDALDMIVLHLAKSGYTCEHRDIRHKDGCRVAVSALIENPWWVKIECDGPEKSWRIFAFVDVVGPDVYVYRDGAEHPSAEIDLHYPTSLNYLDEAMRDLVKDKQRRVQNWDRQIV